MRLGFFLFFLLALHTNYGLAVDIIVFRSTEKEFTDMFSVLQSNLKKYELQDIAIDKNYTYEQFRAAVLVAKPKSLILLDNRSIHLAKQLRKESDPYLARLRGVAGMGLNLKSELKDDEQLCGVAYEVPGYTLVTNFRKIYRKPLSNILVLYRSSRFKQEIVDAHKQLDKEGIAVVAVDVEANGTSEDDIIQVIDKSLKQDYDGKPINAIWVLADNAVLNVRTFSRFWVARSKELSVPFICGIRQFAEPKLNFCSYAASPRNDGIANQLVEMTLAILEDGATPAELGVEYLLGTENVVNSKKFKDLGLPFELAADSEATVLE